LVDFVFYLVGFRFCCILIDLQMIDRIILYIAQNKSYAWANEQMFFGLYNHFLDYGFIWGYPHSENIGSSRV